MTLAQAKKTAPAFDTNNVAIAVAANDYFIPYCATFLKSMAEHSDSDKNYDILLLSQDVSDINVKNVKKNAFCVEKYFSAGASIRVY